ncbi:MAG: zinc-binding alcohol dehydrogenase family protein [Eubacteriales bacterium]
MKAIKVAEPFKLEIVEVEKPRIQKPGDVLLRVMAGGICGSDLGIYKGTNSLATYPRIIGHEFSAVVEEIGEGVEGIAVGDKVAVDPVVYCGKCYACTHDRHNVCESLEVMGVHRDGGFSQYLVANYKSLFKTSMDVPFETLCLVEPFSIGAQVNWRGQISEGDTVLIMGCGPIGLTILQVAKMNGARVMMTDLLDSRLELARSMGADLVVNTGSTPMEEAVKQFTDGVGVNVAIDTVCQPTTLDQALQATSQAGRMVCLSTNNKPAAIDPSNITKKELTITGSRLSNFKFKDVIRWMEEGKIKPELIRSHVFHYTEIDKAMKLAMEHPDQVCKIVISFAD